MRKKMQTQEKTNPSQEEIVQTTRLARDHAFDHFDSGRASNASYEDNNNFSSCTDIHGNGSVEPRRELLKLQYRVARVWAPMAIPTSAPSSSIPDELVDGFYETTDRLLP